MLTLSLLILSANLCIVSLDFSGFSLSIKVIPLNQQAIPNGPVAKISFFANGVHMPPGQINGFIIAESS